MTARFGLPQPETAAPAEASPTEAPVAWATAREILLVEDEAINREIGLYFLTDAGFRVTVAEDGLEAVELAGQHRYDLILMDCRCPGSTVWRPRGGYGRAKKACACRSSP